MKKENKLNVVTLPMNQDKIHSNLIILRAKSEALYDKKVKVDNEIKALLTEKAELETPFKIGATLVNKRTGVKIGVITGFNFNGDDKIRSIEFNTKWGEGILSELSAYDSVI